MAEQQQAQPDQGEVGRPLNLPLPKNFDGSPEKWQTWYARFSRYRLCSGLHRKPDLEQVGVFLYSMGDVADDLLATMNVDEAAVTYERLIEHFQQHFGARKNIITSRARFNKRVQKSGEKMDTFLTDLHRLAEDCEYGALKEELIRDRIVVGVVDDQLSEKTTTGS